MNPNRRILIVDDNEAIHSDFRKILGAPDAADAALDAAEARLFGAPQRVWFEIDSASQGDEGLKMVERSLAEGRPYSMAFVDFRMPPGWDGIETTKQLWQVCPDLQIVICTAYADCPWETVLEELNALDRLLILKKPFDAIEVVQLARALTEKWSLREESKNRLGTLEQLVKDRTREVEESRTSALGMRDEAIQNREKSERTLEELRHEMLERKKVEAQLLHAQKMEAIGQLAGGIAHDFNNILASIMGNTELAKMDARVSPNTADYLDSILKATGRAADLVRRILAFSRRQDAERKPVYLQLVLEEAVKLMRPTMPATIEFKLNLKPTRTVLADSSQIHQVIMNLCTNAAHAMRNGAGVLNIELAEIEVDAVFAQSHADLRPGSYARVVVSDNGCGIEKAILERIFEPFFTTKAPGEGSGLGLSVVHGIIKRHEGAITVQSQPGVGTTFHLYFLICGAESNDTLSDVDSLPCGRGQNILFVDDEQPLITVGKTILQHLGYQVTTASSSAGALAAVRDQPEKFDLVVTDLTMPGMTGIELAQLLLTIRPQLPIILTTGYSADLTSEVVRQNGFRELLLKPITMRTLGTAVHRVFAPSIGSPNSLAG
ncbi:hypothetical protein LBMAG56_36120 [Verrucomicrobiota bacterium]|nr:hypothetical protein LBMAG56_36120 [Verrucomicrobiota bacterium]